MNLDLSYLEEITSGDPGMMREMLNIFIQDIPNQIENINEFADNGDYQKLGAEAHKLKPTTQYIGYNDLYEVVKKLEALGKEGKETAEINTKVSEMNKLFKPLVPALKSKMAEFN